MEQNRDFSHIWNHHENEDFTMKQKQIDRMWQEYEEWKSREGVQLSMQVEEEVRMFQIWKSTLRRFKYEIALILVRIQTDIPPRDTLLLFPVIQTKRLNPDTLNYE
jgi:hypothetical protein